MIFGLKSHWNTRMHLRSRPNSTISQCIKVQTKRLEVRDMTYLSTNLYRVYNMAYNIYRFPHVNYVILRFGLFGELLVLPYSMKRRDFPHPKQVL